ncbi:hypothetical protein BDY21DRAFT_388310 [Lineolata rhizophorae]|uniref:Uncharacterized protein n=1 Tax=Lineolata rhizophorae TaxID=578093 RepID=A0A6A6NN81_9PEZI|nr:hypothetical protein BDY21DRAFT_388310 [Lineolata rhizophorae]
MSGPNVRKRKHADESPPAPQPNSPESCQPGSPTFYAPKVFWDGLSKIWFTKSALRELDRRNRRLPPCQPRPQPTQAKPATEFICDCSPRTLQEIRLSSMHGGPDLRNLRGCPEPGSKGNPCIGGRSLLFNLTTSTETTTNKTSEAYDLNFEQLLIDGDSQALAKPNNWEEINERLAKASRLARTEDDIMRWVIPKIIDICTANECAGGHPDFYHGVPPEWINQQVRRELCGRIVPTKQTHPAAPNFFLETKGPDGSLAVSTNQACYNGALGARGMAALQAYGQSDHAFSGNAYTITCTYVGDLLRIYTSYPIPPARPGARPEYAMHRIMIVCMTSTIEEFCRGSSALRNAMDWAGEQRNALIERANQRALEAMAGYLLLRDAGTSRSVSKVHANEAVYPGDFIRGKRALREFDG